VASPATQLAWCVAVTVGVTAERFAPRPRRTTRTVTFVLAACGLVAFVV